jgi:hypothetical protein
MCGNPENLNVFYLYFCAAFLKIYLTNHGHRFIVTKGTFYPITKGTFHPTLHLLTYLQVKVLHRPQSLLFYFEIRRY